MEARIERADLEARIERLEAGLRAAAGGISQLAGMMEGAGKAIREMLRRHEETQAELALLKERLPVQAMK